MNPKELSKGYSNVVIAINEFEVAKIFTGDTKNNITSEAEKMMIANSINDLLVKFLRIELVQDEAWLVMERLYHYDYRYYDQKLRSLYFNAFEYKLQELHQAGFVHKHLVRSKDFGGSSYDNILLLEEGIRLIDVGNSVIKDQVDNASFELYCKKEMEGLKQFKQYFLNR